MTAGPRADHTDGAPASRPLAEDLPADLRERPTHRRQWDAPTAWLLGIKLLASLRDILLNTVLKFDPRDWMTAGAPLDLRSKITPARGAEPAGCWIDYLSDSGDSQRLVWQLAYLLQQPDLEVRVTRGDGDGVLAHPDGSARRLPRGAALVFGGDTAYPVATRRQLVEHVVAPFVWARDDLAGAAAPLAPPVTLLGLAGNHDYYDGLNGYERQFHDRGPPTTPPPPHERQALPGYELRQRASYFAVLLPYHWQLWALDLEHGKIDDLQLAYFRAAAADPAYAGASKRIVMTSIPGFVYHGVNPEAPQVAVSLRALGLEAPFADGRGELTGEHLRLDLSGDVHTYERYWGTDGEVHTIPVGPGGAGPAQVAANSLMSALDPAGNYPGTERETPQRPNYASVVSGLGGAFHHPSQIRHGGDAPRRSWPACSDSARAIGSCLLHPRKVFQAGSAGLVGMVVAAMCYVLTLVASPPQEASLVGARAAVTRSDLRNLVIIASIVLTFIVLGAITGLCTMLGNRLVRVVSEMGAPTTWWARLTRAASHNPLAFVALRGFGGNRRTLWALFITVPAWGLAIAAWLLGVWALRRCPVLAIASDGFVPGYVAIVLVVLLLAVLGAWVGGAHAGVRGRIAAGALGAAVGALIVWTPYAWTRLALLGSRWALAFPAYYLLRKRLFERTLFTLPVLRRRWTAVGAFFAIAAFYFVIPLLVVAPDQLRLQPPGWGAAIAAVFGGYLTCLWLGWYFFLCLQWNGHGNQAGGAARVVAFAEFMRIKLTDDRAEVWVIAAEAPAPTGPRGLTRWLIGPPEAPPIARLVDHFVVERAPPPAPPS